MQKIILMSVVIAMICVPIVAARDRNPVRSLKKTFLVLVLFNLAYLLVLKFVYPHFQ
jgi:hypothetical protein